MWISLYINSNLPVNNKLLLCLVSNVTYVHDHQTRILDILMYVIIISELEYAITLLLL